ncbi:hypothetical protein [Streptomyces sp. RTd22]|uniref:hypothetical protein n=1 Tax=Streptomyces sp. RTd22 TaxID=1841249 RepID=UPI000A509E94|nr:hypothetical protein [Streptomyces sp. RTd22]
MTGYAERWPSSSVHLALDLSARPVTMTCTPAAVRAWAARPRPAWRLGTCRSALADRGLAHAGALVDAAVAQLLAQGLGEEYPIAFDGPYTVSYGVGMVIPYL